MILSHVCVFKVHQICFWKKMGSKQTNELINKKEFVHDDIAFWVKTLIHLSAAFLFNSAS